MSLASARSLDLDQLRVVVQRSTRSVPHGASATGLAAVDQLLGGGLPRRRLTEIYGRRSSGRTALSLAALAAATGRGEAVALIDVNGVLDAAVAERAGVALGELLWVRAGDVKRGVQATDLLLGAGGFGLVVLDLGEAVPRVPDAAWLRLARGAERSPSPGTALLVVATGRACGSFAALSLEVLRARAIFDGDGAPTGEGSSAPRVFRGVEMSLAVARSRLGAPGGEARLGWRWR